MHIKYKVWLLFVISIFAFVYMSATYEKPSCVRTLRVDELGRLENVMKLDVQEIDQQDRDCARDERVEQLIRQDEERRALVRCLREENSK